MPVHTEWKTFSGTTATCRVYIASMEAVQEPRPTVIVIQEIWGVEEHIEDVTRRFAEAGYVAIAPDLFAVNGVRPVELSQTRLQVAKSFLHSLPHTAWFDPQEREAAVLKEPSDQQESLRETLNALFGMLSPAQSSRFIDILTDTATYARHSLEGTKGMPVTSVGFCMGGLLSALLATKDPEHAGSIVFYGRPPQRGIEDIPCEILGFYGEEDPNITDLLPDFQEEMKKHGKSLEAVVYAGANHAFFNDTNPTYDVNASRDAFSRSLAFLNRVTKN